MSLYQHQQAAINKATLKKNFAYFMEMGTGKTRCVIEEAKNLYLYDDIDSVVIFAPKGVHSNWVDEIDKFCNCSYQAYLWSSSDSNRRKKMYYNLLTAPNPPFLQFFCLNIDAIRIKAVREAINKHVEKGSCMLVIDESSRIKNHKAQRTKQLILAGRKAKYRRILSGTPITKSPLDLFSQYDFLDPKIIGIPSFYAFRNRYAIMKEIPTAGGAYIKIPVGFQNVSGLVEKVENHTFMIKKEECLDLPDKIYQTIKVDLTAEMRVNYQEVVRGLVAKYKDSVLLTENVLTEFLRVQQIVGGFFHGEGETHAYDPNPKLEELKLLMESLENKSVIIWARFRNEIDMIHHAFPNSVVYDGRSSDIQRRVAIAEFQAETTRIFIGNQAAGGLGINLTAADYVIYYSNSFDLEHRLQSEDRAHRIGQNRNVVYIDLIAENTIDEHVLQALKQKQNYSELFKVSSFHIGDLL